MADFLIILLIVAYCIFLYVRHRKKKKDGTAGSCCGCSGCSGCEAGCGGVSYNELWKDKEENSDG